MTEEQFEPGVPAQVTQLEDILALNGWWYDPGRWVKDKQTISDEELEEARRTKDPDEALHKLMNRKHNP